MLTSKRENIISSEISIYDTGFAQVNELRSIDEIKDNDILNIEEISNDIMLDSLILEGINYDIVKYNSIDSLIDSNLKSFINKNVILYDRNFNRYEALLLSYKSLKEFTCVLKGTNEVLINPQLTIAINSKDYADFKSYLQVKTKENNFDNFKLSYSTYGLSWTPKYTVLINNNVLSIKLNAEILNNTNKNITKSKINLVTGVEKNYSYGSKFMLKGAILEESNNYLEPSSTENYFKYTLNEEIDIDSNEIIEVRLFNFDNIHYDKYIRTNSSSDNFTRVIEIKNDKEKEIGVYLPKGECKLFKKDENVNESIGSSTIKRTNIGETINIEYENSNGIIKTEEIVEVSDLNEIKTMKAKIKFINKNLNIEKIHYNFYKNYNEFNFKANEDFINYKDYLEFKFDLENNGEKEILITYEKKYK